MYLVLFQLGKRSLVMNDSISRCYRLPVTVPVGLAAFPHEIVYVPEAFVAGKYTNVVQFTRMPDGGHFSALEEPELVANDIISFVTKVEDTYERN